MQTKRIYKEYTVVGRTDPNRFKPVRFGAVFCGYRISRRPNCNWRSGFFAVRSGPVATFFRLREPDLQTLDGIILNWIAPDSTRHFEEEDRSPEEIVRAVARRHRDRAAPYTGNMNEIPQQLLMPSVHDASLAGSREGMA